MFEYILQLLFLLKHQSQRIVLPLGSVFVPADDSLFILFCHVPGVSTSSTDMVLSEEPDTTLITPLGTIALSVYGLFTLSPLPF